MVKSPRNSYWDHTGFICFDDTSVDQLIQAICYRTAGFSGILCQVNSFCSTPIDHIGNHHFLRFIQRTPNILSEAFHYTITLTNRSHDNVVLQYESHGLLRFTVYWSFKEKAFHIAIDSFYSLIQFSDPSHLRQGSGNSRIS